MKASVGSSHEQCELSVQAQGQCQSQSFVSSPSVRNENVAAAALNELTLSIIDPNTLVDAVNSRSSVPVEVTSNESQQRQGLDSGIQVTPSNHEETNSLIATERSLEDGYNWRKYGQKHIKGSEFPRSYYRCSYPNCQVKKQLERSHDGRITEITYKGKHDHPKPQPGSPVVASSILSVQEERSDRFSFSNSTEDKPSNLNGQTSHHTKPDDTLELSPIAVIDNDVEGARAQLNRIRDEVNDDDDPECKRRCLKLNTEAMRNVSAGSNHQQCKPSVLVQGQCSSLTIISSSSIENENVTASSHESTVSLIVPNAPVDAVTSRAIAEVNFDESRQRPDSESGVQPMQLNDKGASPSLATERFCGDGYNWRKYGQKHIKGSEFPRSYYRCTHPNCQVKKQLERSHDGQITDTIYKGKHDHPKPQPSNHMAVGRILSFQEERSDGFPSLKSTEEKSSNGHCQASHDHHTELKVTPEISPVATSENDAQREASQSNMIGEEVEDDDDLESKHSCPKFTKETDIDVSAGSNHQKCKMSVQVEVQGQSLTPVFSPSVKNENRATPSHEMPLSVIVPNPPVYMVTSRGIVPIEVDSDESMQRHGSDSGLQATKSSHKRTSPKISLERLLDNAYHWRKYGQKNIKGSEFPRSYYRCTYPNCLVKMQLVRSHDGRITEIICKGKHDHPKPQPCSRMAVGAILSIQQEETTDILSSLNNTEDISSNGHSGTSPHAKLNGTPELFPATASDDDVEGTGEQPNRTENETEDGNDPEYKRRKEDTGDVHLTPFGRTTKEPRVVVETLSEVDAVDDGYRWCKYGRKMVKGNPNPRNYYRCSNTGCSVKKHVERASHNPKTVITTYEGKHNHDPPTARTTGHDTAGSIIHNAASNGTLATRAEESDTISLDVGVGRGSSPEDISGEQQQAPEIVPFQSLATVSGINGDFNDSADPDKSRKDDGQSFSFDTTLLNHSSHPNPEKIGS